jgi:hypothetical protein
MTGARERRPEQVARLVDGVGLDGGEDVVGDELLLEVLDDDLVGAGANRLLADRLEVLVLPDVAHVGHDGNLVRVFEPGEDDARVESPL